MLGQLNLNARRAALDKHGNLWTGKFNLTIVQIYKQQRSSWLEHHVLHLFCGTLIHDAASNSFGLGGPARATWPKRAYRDQSCSKSPASEDGSLERLSELNLSIPL